MVKNFKDLSEAEILALAISNEETDGRIYADFTAPLCRFVNLPKEGAQLASNYLTQNLTCAQ
jgi:hypothetical protein